MARAKRLVVLRRASQAFFALLFIYILWSTTYPMTGPLPAGTFFKFDPLIVFMISLSERVAVPGIACALGMLAVSAVIGRFFCGWACPLGAAFDLAALFRRRHPRVSDAANAVGRKIKFCILAVVAAAAVFGIQVAWVLDPLVVAARFVSLNLIPGITLVLNRFCIFLIRDLRAPPAVLDLYRAVKPTLLGVKIAFFAHAGAIFLFFLAACALSLVIKRFWCRALCPLGAIYAIVSRRALLRRTFEGCTACGICKSECRMGAIRDDLGYAQGECILCMDCVYDCPQHVTRFRFGRGRTPAHCLCEKGAGLGGRSSGISRRQFLLFLSTVPFLAGFRLRGGGDRPAAGVIRPPAALREEDFVDRCIRCGNCMKVCITNGLQPVLLQSGLRGIWAPQLVPEVGYCEYRCTLCGKTCPTRAIRPVSVEEKMRTSLGLAVIDRRICIPWAEGRECIVCQEHCPVPDKALKLDRSAVTGADGKVRNVARPYVDPELCIGCGICQNKCPVRPVRAIRVQPLSGSI